MSLDQQYCLVGSKQPLFIYFRKAATFDDTTIIVAETERGPYTNSPSLRPKEMLEFEMGHSEWKEVNGEMKFMGWKMEPPGWFARRCEEANCSWFVPMVERMAAGEKVSLEEIECAYRQHNNGKKMPLVTNEEELFTNG